MHPASWNAQQPLCSDSRPDLFPCNRIHRKKKTKPHIFHMEVMLSEANAPCACHGDYDDPRRMEPFTGARILGTIARLKNVPPPT